MTIPPADRPRPADPKPSAEPRPAGASAPSGSFAETLASALSKLESTPESRALTAELITLERAKGNLFPAESGLSTGALGQSAALQVLLRALAEAAVSKEAGSDVGQPSTPAALSPGELDDLVAEAARRNDLDPSLVDAVIRAESGYDPKAVSPAGALGLMQLMPGTAKDLGVTDPLDPAQNVGGGARYFKTLLDRYDGDVDAALAAYNWGPANVDRAPGALPRETREYVARVKDFLRRKA